MINILSFAIVLLLVLFSLPVYSNGQKDGRFKLVIHGGAGAIERAKMTPELEKAYREKLAEALKAGHKILNGGGSSLDAIEAVIRMLEDSPLFNAGKGAVFTNEGA